jgi:hypothetical protein
MGWWVWEFHPVFDAVYTHLVNQKKESKKFLFHFSKEDLFPHFIQIWTRSFKIILLKNIHIYRAIHALQPRKMLKQLDIYV